MLLLFLLNLNNWSSWSGSCSLACQIGYFLQRFLNSVCTADYQLAGNQSEPDGVTPVRLANQL